MHACMGRGGAPGSGGGYYLAARGAGVAWLGLAWLGWRGMVYLPRYLPGMGQGVYPDPPRPTPVLGWVK